MPESDALRARLVQAILTATVSREEVLAIWEGGSTAMGRADQWSDLDLQLIVQDGHVAAVREAVERAIGAVSPVELCHEVPQPSWHGHWQSFYKLRDAGPYLQIDLVIMEESNPNRFLEPEIHGHPLVYLDRQGLLQPRPTDAKPFADRLQKRLLQLEQMVELFHPFVDKELLRGREVDAYSFYHGLVLNRLVEVLRMRHTPWRYNFGLRYLERDLPPAAYQAVRSLVYVASPVELPAKKEQALTLFRQTLAELKSIDLEQALETTRER